MNIGDATKLIKKDFASVTISRIRFLEKEGLIKPKRSKGGTRTFSDKDIEKIKKILDLQENQFYSLKAIKNNPKLISVSNTNSKITINKYSKHEALKKSGLQDSDYNELLEYNFEKLKEIYSQQDVERFSSLAYLFSLGIGVKNLTIIKSMTDRGVGFLESYIRTLNMDNDDAKVAVEKFSIVIGSYILEDLY
ncbi:MerR family transcriptional regulator [Acidimicrobiaceae bacterium]|nr:MerR family transcriptional regulator [Acidimicrobiaceae bacterium]